MLRKFDHAGIFVMIAGSYTPFFLVALDGSWRWVMILSVWCVALFGVFAKLCLPGIAKGFWVAIYLLLGWAGIVVINQMIAGLDSAVLWLIVAGGAFTPWASRSTCANPWSTTAPSGTPMCWAAHCRTGAPSGCACGRWARADHAVWRPRAGRLPGPK